MAGSALTNHKTSEPTTPEQQRLDQAIETHILQLETLGRGSVTTNAIRYHLRKLSQSCNLFDSRETLLYISRLKTKKDNKPISKGYYKKLVFAYCSFCDTNQIPYDKPTVHYEPPSQIIPTTEQVNAIINTAEADATTLFTILAETAVEQEELHKTPRKQIDLETGTISIVGLKGHANGVYKLKPRTANMLRVYLSKPQRINLEYPFPKPKTISERWRRARAKASKKLSRPELMNIPLKNLRNYAGAVFYKTVGQKDFMATMRFMRHKRPDTTLHYIRLICLDEPEEYTTKTVKIGTPDTQKQIVELLNAGYAYITDADEYKYFRKLGKEEEHKS